MIESKSDIVETVEMLTGETLQKRGKHYRMLCPFHAEREPSFIADINRQRAHCFGCNWDGDSIAFTMKYHNCTFKETLKILGVNGNGKKFKPDPKRSRQRELLKKYEAWKATYLNYLCDSLRRLDRLQVKAKTLRQVERMSWAYHRASEWECHFEILLSKDEEIKFDLYRELEYGC